MVPVRGGIGVACGTILALAAMLVGVLVGSSAVAMSVQPILIDMTPYGREAAAVIRATNSAARPLPMEIVVSRLRLGPNGEQELEPAGDEDFLIFPPQAMIEPNSAQVFRVQWVGDPDLTESRTYVFSVNQLPVALPEGVSAIQLLYSFAVLVNVAPGDMASDLALTGADLVVDDEGRLRPRITVRNDGPVHGYLSRARVDLTARDAGGAAVWSQSLTPEQIGQRIGIGLVQPWATRHFTLPFPLEAEAASLEADLVYVGRRR